MPKSYDLVVIGAGTAARIAAMRVRKAGQSVAVIDCRPYGGTCALRGCDPKKMLRHGAAVIDDARRKGIETPEERTENLNDCGCPEPCRCQTSCSLHYR